MQQWLTNRLSFVGVFDLVLEAGDSGLYHFGAGARELVNLGVFVRLLSERGASPDDVVRLAVAPLIGPDSMIGLKRDRTPREVVAHVLDYGSRVTGSGYEQIAGLYSDQHEGARFEAAFEGRFGDVLPEALRRLLPPSEPGGRWPPRWPGPD